MRLSFPKYVEDIALLEDMGRFHPLGACALRRLQKLKQQWDLTSDNPAACVLAPYAWSTAMELTNETDVILVPFDAGQAPAVVRAAPRIEFSTIFPELVAPLPPSVTIQAPSQTLEDFGMYQATDIELDSETLNFIGSLD
jgi:hypothetical protein